MRKRILFSALGGSPFPYLHSQLIGKYDLYYVDNNSYLSYVYPDFNFLKAPNVVDKDYIPFVKTVIEKNKIDFYIPLIDEEIVGAKELEGYNQVKTIAPAIPFCTLSTNKFQLMNKLRELGISFIESYTGDNFLYDTDKTYFVKPIVGRGSRGIKRINSPQQLQAYYVLEEYQPVDILIQEYIEGTEYSIGAAVNSLNQLLLVGIRRIISKKGITQIAVTEKNDFLFGLVEKIVDELKPCGPINIQLFLTPNNEPKIFEINPRFSTTSIMNYAAGVNEIDLITRNFDQNYTGTILQPKENVFLYRRWESVFYEA